jgi:DedD protein
MPLHPERPAGHHEQPANSSTKRRLIAAAALIGVAIIGLAVVDRFREQPPGPRPPHEPAQALIATPAPESDTATATTGPYPSPPSPPEVINNETLVPPRRPAEPAPPTSRSGTTAPDSRAVTDKAYIIQVGVFTSPANAKAVQKQLKRAGMQAHLETRVQLGPYRDKREAERALARARELGIDAVMINPRRSAD